MGNGAVVVPSAAALGERWALFRSEDDPGNCGEDVNAEKGKNNNQLRWTGSGTPLESVAIHIVNDFGGADVASDLGVIAAGLVAEGFPTVRCNAAMLRVPLPGYST